MPIGSSVAPNFADFVRFASIVAVVVWPVAETVGQQIDCLAASGWQHFVEPVRLADWFVGVG